MERDCRTGTIDGARTDSDCRPNVFERTQFLPQSNSLNYALVVAYNGANYYGWQKVPSGQSIQQYIEAACEKILREPVFCEAASRTDRGVHAKGQVVQFFSSKSFDIKHLPKALNSSLPKDIRILEAALVPSSFHPTLDAIGKEYHYEFCLGAVQEPFHQKTSFHYPYPVNLSLMEQAATLLTGTHDFSSFTTEPQENSIRTLYSIEITPLPAGRLRIVMKGDRFLYKMARTIAGTIADVGSNKCPLSSLPTLLTHRKRAAAGRTAPAHGLTLYKIFYKT